MIRDFSFFIASLAIGLTVGIIDERFFALKDIITKDVAILSGGASETFAAVSPREYLNTKHKNRLGGHVDTYTIPDTNTTIEYGVQSYMHYGPADTFFKRMGVGFGGPYSLKRSTNLSVDLKTGKLLKQHESYFNPGYWDFFASKDIPKELLMPFGEFASMYGIGAAAPRIAAIFNVGLGVKAPCIPENYPLSFVSPAAVPNDHLAVRDSPWTLHFDSTGPVGLEHFRIPLRENYIITSPQFKEKIQTELYRTMDAGTLNSTGKCDIEWKAFSNHYSVAWGQSTEQLRGGFIQKLYGLQGHRGTWYTGGLWCGIYSRNFWALTATVLPKLLGGL